MAHDPDTGKRNKARTKRRLIEATIEILRERGFEQLGVNAVAERAGVSKVLIYRYFGNLSGLFHAVADELDPLQTESAERLLQFLNTDATAGQIMEGMVTGLHRSLSEDELTKQLLVSELTRQNELTETLSAAREEVGLQLTRRLADELHARGVPQELDVNALVTLVYSAVLYLTLRSDTAGMYNGIDIQSDEGWSRLASTLRLLVDRMTGPESS